MIKVLEIARSTARSYDERWGSRGIHVIRVSYDRAFEVINSPATSELIVDLVVIRGDYVDPETGRPEPMGDLIALNRRIRHFVWAGHSRACALMNS
jgi:hypothetical protein